MILDWVGALKETRRCCLWTGAVEEEAVWDLQTEEKEPTKAQARSQERAQRVQSKGPRDSSVGSQSRREARAGWKGQGCKVTLDKSPGFSGRGGRAWEQSGSSCKGGGDVQGSPELRLEEATRALRLESVLEKLSLDEPGLLSFLPCS